MTVRAIITMIVIIGGVWGSLIYAMKKLQVEPKLNEDEEA